MSGWNHDDFPNGIYRQPSPLWGGNMVRSNTGISANETINGCGREKNSNHKGSIAFIPAKGASGTPAWPGAGDFHGVSDPVAIYILTLVITSETLGGTISTGIRAAVTTCWA